MALSLYDSMAVTRSRYLVHHILELFAPSSSIELDRKQKMLKGNRHEFAAPLSGAIDRSLEFTYQFAFCEVHALSFEPLLLKIQAFDS